MSDKMERSEVVDLMVSKPWELLNRFGIGREEFLGRLMEELIEAFRADVGGTLAGLFPLHQDQAQFLSGLGRHALLSSEHIDGGNRAKKWTIEQALKARDRRIKKKVAEEESPEDKVKRLEAELEEAKREAA